MRTRFTRRTGSSQRTSQRRRRRGFTLVEIMVVVTIIALLAGVVVLKLTGVLGSSKTKIARTKATAIATALELYVMDGGNIEDGMDLAVLRLGPQEGVPSGPLLKNDQALIDPWGNPYVVRVPGVVNADFDIVSFGSDGQPGGEGEAQDVTNS